jgi:hypothetical protein
MRVAKFAHNTWTWAQKDVLLVVLGDFLDRFRNTRNKLTTAQAISDEIDILHCFESLQAQPESTLIILMGNHELGNLVRAPNYEEFQMAKPSDEDDKLQRDTFLRKWFTPFVTRPFATGILAQWTNVLMCHGGLEAAWLQRHEIKSIQDLNRRYQNALGHRAQPDGAERSHRASLDIFLEPDSPLLSRKMAYFPEAWRREDRDIVREILCPEILHPVFCLGHTTVSDIRTRMIASKPQCEEGANTSILTSQDYDGRDEIYFLDVGMSDGFLMPGATFAQRFAQRPQCLCVEYHSYRDSGYHVCRVLSATKDEFLALDRARS